MPTLFLDRDGVINRESRDFIRGPDDWVPIEGSLQAIAQAQQHGFRILVISNQSGLGRGLFGIRELNRIHARMQNELANLGARVEAFFFCPHVPDAGCGCRKPLPGLLLDAGQRLGIDLSKTTLIGDRETDAAAALSAGVRAMLVETGQHALQNSTKVPVHKNLAAAVESLLHC
mgnify:CR=1 FL=1